MFQTVKGCSVPLAEKLKEEYKLKDGFISANVSAENIKALFDDFILMHSNEDLFLILEIPTNANNETENEEGIIEQTHKDVYYLDGLTPNQALDILEEKCELLINDGISCFGFGCPDSQEEMMLMNYNIINVLSPHIREFTGLFEKHNIRRNDNMITAWETFTHDTPGTSSSIKVNGEDIYSLAKYFMSLGMYFAERREE